MHPTEIQESKLEKVFGITDDELPQIAKFERKPKQQKIENLQKAVKEQLDKIELKEEIQPKASIGVTAGSRGISNIDKIIKYTIDYLKNEGAEPFVFPAMGSHGGATSKGQKEMLKSLGITEKTIGCPIKATMDTKKIGETENGFPVLVDATGYQADGIFVINRVKSHPAFNGEIESGLMKMMAIGMGNQRGARMSHKQGFSCGLDAIIPNVGKIILEKLPIIGGLALVENFYHKTAIIKGIRPPDFLDVEEKLLTKSKELMPTLPNMVIDVLIVDEMGKNISGTGMDTNVIGRYMTLGVEEPKQPSVSRIYVRDLTEESHGNATGIGLADFTHWRLINKLNLQDTYVNSLNGTGPDRCRIPAFFKKDKTALKACFASIGTPLEDAKLLWIKNTMELCDFFASRPLFQALDSDKKRELKRKGPWRKFGFDKNGNFSKKHRIH